MAKNFISEDDIEQGLIQRLQHLCGFNTLNCHTPQPDDLNDGSGRTDKREAILASRLRAAVERLNPQAPAQAVDQAMAQLLQPRTAMSLAAANREMDGLIRDGVPVTYKPETGPQADQTVTERLRVIHFDEPDPKAGHNDYLVVSQLWIRGEHGYRRPDVLLYVNGLPLVFIELKNSNVKLRAAFDDNLTTYKAVIPQLFVANALCLLSNGIETKVGSLTAQWEHFFAWLRVDDEKEPLDRKDIAQRGLSVERVVAGLLMPERLLDYVENFCVFYKETQKVIAQNHQFLGVNNAFVQFTRRRELGGKLGVFWHTQGSGKSFSMVFYTRKIFRKLTGNFTFVVVTDRLDLNRQIYRNFLYTGVVRPSDDVLPESSAQLRDILGTNKRVVFARIQQFRNQLRGTAYPLLSARDDIIVIVDEAHRTQYANLAENMRTGLPKANYLAFTGTPLLGKERKTNAWFGNYISEYNFQQSVEDGATVPLYYQKRVPEVLIHNDDLSEEFAQILEDENLDDQAQEKLEKRFAQEMAVIKVDDRLDTIAKDIVFHFPRRGYLGKAIVISVDKFTAVTMYNKVQVKWKDEIKALTGRISATKNDVERQRLKQLKAWMSKVEMAVIVSEEAGEEEKFAKKGLDIKPHRKRMSEVDEHGHDIEYNFKDSDHPLQLVFVCAMWLTGFDAPTVSTLYLDKPMQGHTLMQTIARANRVSGHEINGVAKRHGEVVDYYNVFRRMKKALRDYAAGPDDEELPVKDKSQLFVLLDEAIEQGFSFCHAQGVALHEALERGDVFTKLGQFNGFANTLLASDELRKSYNVYENTISSLYEACKPEVLGQGKGEVVSAFQYLRGVMDAIVGQVDIDSAVKKIEALMDESVVVDNAETFTAKEFQASYQIVQRGKHWDLSKVNVEKLREEFKQAEYKNIEIADLQAFLQKKLEQMLEQNTTRTDFLQRLQKVIDAYNSGATATENYFDELTAFAQSLKEEAERHIREGLTEDELELFDLLKKDPLTQEETHKVKLAAKHLLKRLVEEHPKVLVQDWHKDSQTQKQVRAEIERVLDKDLPESYDRATFKQKCENVYEMIVNYALHQKKWAA